MRTGRPLASPGPATKQPVSRRPRCECQRTGYSGGQPPAAGQSPRRARAACDARPRDATVRRGSRITGRAVARGPRRRAVGDGERVADPAQRAVRSSECRADAVGGGDRMVGARDPGRTRAAVHRAAARRAAAGPGAHAGLARVLGHRGLRGRHRVLHARAREGQSDHRQRRAQHPTGAVDHRGVVAVSRSPRARVLRLGRTRGRRRRGARGGAGWRARRSTPASAMP